MDGSDRPINKFPFQAAKDAADILARRHHLTIPYKTVIYSAAEKGDNYSGYLYRVIISGRQGERYVELENDGEYIKYDPVNDEIDSILSAHGILDLNVKNEDIKRKQPKNDIHFYNPDDFVEFPYDEGEHLALNYIFKIAPSSKARREQQNVKAYFKREVLMYTKLLPRFMKMQKLNKVKNVIEFPRIFAYSLEEEKEFIVLEDLKASGYKMYSRHKTLDYEHACLAMINIGKFHALSLVMKHEYPEEFEEYKHLSENIFVDPLPETYILHWKKSFQQAIDTLEPNELDLINKMRAFQEDHADTFLKFTKGSHGEPYSCINHGDFWNNNMMFHYKNQSYLQDGSPSNVKFLDFQMSRYCSPLLDLTYYLFCCTDGNFRRDYYEEMLNIYYKSFSNFTEELGCNPTHLMPLSEFQKEVKRYGIYGLSMAIIGLIFFITNKEDSLSLDELAEQVAENNTKELKIDLTKITLKKYKERMSAIIRDTSKYGYFTT